MKDLKNPIIGIDLGTTHSLVAFCQEGQPRILESLAGERLVPSAVYFASETLVQVGTLAKSQKLKNPKTTVLSVKRLLGKGMKDIGELAHPLPHEIIADDESPHSKFKIKFDHQSFSAVEISSMILKELKKIAENALGTVVEQAVITVPAYFNDSQRQETRFAGKLAGLDVIRILNEPTAAALAYGLNQKKTGNIAVYDFGGGTFDISILKLQEGIFEVLSTHGDTSLGGDDIDLALVEDYFKHTIHSHQKEKVSDEAMAILLERAEQTKKMLSVQSQALFQVGPPHFEPYEKLWTQEAFSDLISPLLERTTQACERALEDAHLQKEDLSDIILVGGPTRLPSLQSWIKNYFHQELNTSMHPDEVVALGAAIQAEILSGRNQGLLLLDVVPLSLGIETYGGVMAPLIPRNTRIPAAVREVFTTYQDHQTAVDLHVYQGESHQVEHNRSLGRFKLYLAQKALAKEPRIEVTFLVDADGILQVTGKDLHSGQMKSIEMHPTYGLSLQDIDKMLFSTESK